ncbi:MAG: alpha/beta hydrolase [Acidiferrobacterales bacterium]|nr:alpha/beta hydrolase [Acidiferrobacterales bacterium]
MKRFLRYLLNIFLLLVLVLMGALLIFWEEDWTRETLVAKYANANSEFFTTKKGDVVHFRDEGTQNKPALVMIHGTAASLHTWEPLIAALASDFRLVSLDLPGHGLTGAFKARDYSNAIMTETVLELIDHLGLEKVVLMGNSLGGKVAWTTAVEQPSRVQALILLAPSGAQRVSEGKSNIGFKILRSWIGQQLMQKISPRFLIEKSLKQTVTDSDLVTQEMVDRYWQLLLMEGNRQAIVDLRNSDQGADKFRLLSEVAAPSLIVWGENDGILPIDMIRQFESRMSESQSLRLTNIGHLPQEESVDTLSERVKAFCADNCQ